MECFSLDELVARTALAHRVSQDEIAAALGAAALGTAAGLPFGGGSAARLQAPLSATAETAADAEVARQWCAGVLSLLTRPLAGVDRTAADADADAATVPVLYLARLLHDLRYHVERGIDYYAGLAWWHLAGFLAELPATVGRSAGRTAGTADRRKGTNW